MNISDRWAVDSTRLVSWRHWGAESVAHHALSNHTHRLAEPSGWILDWLNRDGAQTGDALAAAAGMDPELVHAVLQDLASLGLIVRC